VPTQGMDLAGAGTLDLSDNLTLNGNVTLASGSLTIDARGLQLNLGGDLNLVGGVLLTDNSTYFHLLANSTLTTNAEQTVANVTIPANEAPMLTLGNTTILKVIEQVAFGISCPRSLPIQPKVQLRLSAGIKINTGSELCIDGWLEGDIVLNGGTLQVDDDTTIRSDSSILLSSSSNLRIVGGSSLTYEGDALSVDNKTLSLSGGGSLVLNSDGSNPVTLNNADGELEFSGDNITTVSHVKTSSGATTNMPTLKMTGSGVIQNLAHEEFLEINFASGKTLSITEAFEVPYGKQMTILGAAGTLTLGDNMSLTGTLNLAVEDAILSSGSLTLNGGLLEVSEDASISSAVIQKVSSEFSVATGKTLSYTGSSFDISAYTLTLNGGGNFQSGGLDLNNADSKLLLNSITVDSVSTTSDSLGLDVDNNSTITALSVGYITPVSIASGRTLSGAITVTAGSIKLDEAGTLASTIAMSGGTLDADNSSTLSGTLTQSGNITIDVADNKTLTYSGAAVNLGANTLTLSGEGTFSNSNALVLNNASSKLLLSNSITVDNVSTSLASLGLDVDDNSTVSSLTVAHTTPVSIASTKTLSGAITVTAGSLQLDETGTLASTVSMSGGTLDADETLTLSGALSQAGNITIDVATGKTLNYSGAALSLGANTLTLSGGGTLSNTINNALVLNHADSHLVLENMNMGFVSASAASNGTKGLEVSVDSSLTNLSMTDKLRLSVDSGKTLTLAEPLTVSTQGMELAGAGTLDLTDNLTLNGNVTLASGSLTIDARGLLLNLGGDLNLAGGELLTDNTTNFHLIDNSTLTTNAEQTVANVTVTENKEPMLTLGNITKLKVVQLVSIVKSCPQSLPIQPTGQLRLPGGLQIDTGGTLCIDGWLEGDIVLNGGTLQVDADTTISSDSTISLSSSSNLKILGGSSLTYEGNTLNLNENSLS